MIRMTSYLNRVRDHRETQHMKKCWIPLTEAQLQANPWQESQNILVDDIFGTGRTETEPPVLARLRKNFQVGSEGWNDVLFTGQRFRWMKDPQ